MPKKDTKINKINKRLLYAYRSVAAWNKEAKEDINFALGDQWTKEERDILKKLDRPILTFNKIGTQIKLVSGHQTLNAPRIKVTPEGGEDKLFSEACDMGMSYINKISKLNRKLNEQFKEGVTSGKSFLELAIDYEKDPIYGELKSLVPGAFVIIKDPNSSEYDMSDCEYCFKIAKYTKEKLKSMFPGKAKEIDEIHNDKDIIKGVEIFPEGDRDNYGLEPSKVDYDTPPVSETELEEDVILTLIEYWHKKYVTKYFVYNRKTGKLQKFDDEAEAKKAQKEQKKLIEQSPDVIASSKEVRIIERSMPQMEVCSITNDVLLQEAISPFEPEYSGFPFFPFYAEYNHFAQKEILKYKGITRDLKDPQREVNKARSQFLHALNTSLNSGWIYDENTFTSEMEKKMENLGSKPGAMIKKATGSYLERVQPVAPDMAQMLREKAATENFKEISGINPDLLALEDKTTSGRALSIRVQQGLTILAEAFTNFKYTKEMIGLCILRLLPNLLDVAKWMKIVGSKWMAANGVTEGHFRAWLDMITELKYNVTVMDATIKAETFEQLIVLLEKGAPIPIDLILEFSDIPNSSEVIGRVKEEMQMRQQAAAVGAVKR